MFKKKKPDKISSTSKTAKNIIRNEIKAYFSPSERGYGRTALDNMKDQAEASISNREKSMPDYWKGAHLVDDGNFAVYYDDQAEMLKKIYGDKVDEWSGNKIHDTYRNLIGREYAAMLKEREKAESVRLQKKIENDIKKHKDGLKPGDEVETPEGTYTLSVNANTGKYIVHLFPWQTWNGKQIRSYNNVHRVVEGSLAECRRAIKNSGAETKKPTTKTPKSTTVKAVKSSQRRSKQC